MTHERAIGLRTLCHESVLMCGICGFVASQPNLALSEDVLCAMRDTMVHRGPDDCGLYVDTHAGLGHRRLSIVDLAGGHQPMSNEDGSVWVAYNGETYNHMLLRPDLEAAGHRFATRSDTEVLLHAWEEYGDSFVDRLRGMFAFALWNKNRRRMLIVRDRLGIKPLYYAQSNGLLVFGSEIKAVLASGIVEPRLNLQALPEFLALGYNIGATTLFEGIRALPPGHRLVWEDGKTSIEKYWDLQYPQQPMQASENDAIEEFRSLFFDCVKMRLMADVPVGIFLSGGIDSSAIAAAMSRMVDEPIKTFSVGFAERNYSEFEYAREVAQMIGADHHEIVIEPRVFFDELPRLIRHEDEPIRWPSSVPLYFVSKLASEHVKVVLTGEGSDELLAGYGKYWASMQNDHFARGVGRLLPEALRKRVLKPFVWHLPVSMRYRKLLWHSFACRSSKPQDLVYDNFYAILSEDVQQKMLVTGIRDRMNPGSAWSATLGLFEGNSARCLLDRMLYTDTKTYLVELLMKQDQMSMATSLESRVPFLDHKLVEFCSSLPADLKLRGRTGKYILRRAMEGILPESVLRRGKMGFPVPLKLWFADGSNNAARELLTDRAARLRALFDVSKVERILDEHAAHRRDWSEAIWLMLNLELWMQHLAVAV